MTKVLNKAFGILETVLQASPMPVPLMELARELELNKATCSRLARELVEMGYLEQPSARSGFVVGPRAGAFGSRARYAENLAAVAEAPIRAYAEKLRQAAMLVILRRGLRYVLVQHNFNPDMRIDLSPLAFADAFNTATGLVLLAYSGEEEYQAALALRSEALSVRWNERGGDANKDAILEGIREDGHLIHFSTLSTYPSAVAFPVFKGKRFVAAIGASMPREQFAVQEQRDLMVREVSMAAKTISVRLSSVNSI